MVRGASFGVDPHRHRLSPFRLRQIRIQGRNELAPPLRREEVFERRERRLIMIRDRDPEPRKMTCRGHPVAVPGSYPAGHAGNAAIPESTSYSS